MHGYKEYQRISIPVDQHGPITTGAQINSKFNSNSDYLSVSGSIVHLLKSLEIQPTMCFQLFVGTTPPKWPVLVPALAGQTNTGKIFKILEVLRSWYFSKLHD